MKKLLKKLPSGVQLILFIYLTGMLIFSLFRLLLLCLHHDEWKAIPGEIIFQSLLMGLRFDAVINGYLLSFPALVLFIFSFSKTRNPWLEKSVTIYLVAVYTIAFLAHVSDIRWYEHGASRLTVAIMQWTNTPEWMLKFVFQDVSNYPFLILFFVLIYLFYRIVKKMRTIAFTSQETVISLGKKISAYLLLFAFLFIGIRGRLAVKSPIRWGTAFFSPYNFTNQLGLNPVYTFMRSWLDQKKNLEVRYQFMEDAAAEIKVRNQLGITAYEDGISPVARKIAAAGSTQRYHVVVVLMESMSSKSMKRFGNKKNLTPVLDSLYDKAISFSDFYSDGNHTFNGIFSSLYGWHSLPMVHHMKNLTHQQSYGGLPRELFSRGYRTVFFTTHDDQFDNMAGFLLPNGFERIISEKDYQREQVLSTLGVPDHVMFERVIRELDGMHSKNEPFFAAMITGSNHEPHVIPDQIAFKPRSTQLADQIVEYADWSIGEFMAESSSHAWFDSTVFIFTGDHGGLVSGFDHYLAFHHVPLIIFAPKIFSESAVISSVGGQADIYATVCGILNFSYVNNSMGIDLLKSQRRFYPFNFDEEICCVTTDNFLTIGHDNERFYRFNPGNGTLAAAEKTAAADSMKLFLQATMQTTQRMIEERKMK